LLSPGHGIKKGGGKRPGGGKRKGEGEQALCDGRPGVPRKEGGGEDWEEKEIGEKKKKNEKKRGKRKGLTFHQLMRLRCERKKGKAIKGQRERKRGEKRGKEAF